MSDRILTTHINTAERRYFSPNENFTESMKVFIKCCKQSKKKRYRPFQQPRFALHYFMFLSETFLFINNSALSLLGPKYYGQNYYAPSELTF